MTRLLAVRTAFVIAALTQVPAHAVTVTGNGTLAAFPQYGYRYSASWEASAGSFTFVPSFFSSSLATIFRGTLVAGSPTLDVADFDLQLVVQLTYFNIATNQTALPPQMSNKQVFPSFAADYSANGFVGDGFRFSNPVVQTAAALTDTSTGLAISPGSSLPPAAVTFTVTQHFQSGNFLLPSNDPGCTSLSCMVPGHDTLHIGNAGSFVYQIGVVPEAGTAAMLGAGLGVVAMCALRRRRLPRGLANSAAAERN